MSISFAVSIAETRFRMFFKMSLVLHPVLSASSHFCDPATLACTNHTNAYGQTKAESESRPLEGRRDNALLLEWLM